ncbi:Rieske (2Fe-2S) protein [Streptomyces sp. NPDC003327]
MGGVARRTVVAAAGGAGLVAALGACGGGGADDKPDATAGTSGGAGEGDGEAQVLARTGDVPVGGGTVIAAQGVVIVQPKAGEFKAYSSKCTHAGCAVGRVENNAIICPCHQSRFDAADGSVQSGPATAPLPPTPIQVVGDAISFG